ncbi:transposase [Streptomyces sp. NPDC051322]|uniref:IS110 family transposase n=1 Tax=Streptomyces sp. NPDC051322 TaxID=3154645 RepID=UPI00344BCA41
MRGQSVILIGVDPHKSSHTAVAVDAAGHQVAQRRFVVNAGTFRQLMRWCEQWPEHRFAVEGAGGLGRSLAQQLAAAGENVVDMPSTLSARARLLASGGDRLAHRGDRRPRSRGSAVEPSCAGDEGMGDDVRAGTGLARFS